MGVLLKNVLVHLIFCALLLCNSFIQCQTAMVVYCTRNRKVRISIGFNVTSHGEGSLSLTGTGFTFISNKQTKANYDIFSLTNNTILKYSRFKAGLYYTTVARFL